MFVQVIEGTTSQPHAVRERLDIWQKDLMPEAPGFLGATGGVTDTGRVFVMSRFESPADAVRNAARAEQRAWWKETATLFDGEASFQESGDVDLLLAGGSDAAGFVQVIVGRVPDRAALAVVEEELTPDLAAARPDLIGCVRAWFNGDEFVQAAYFTSEADARAGETSYDPGAWLAEVADVTFLDLRELWLTSG